ncbi:MAG: hypothetical protein K8R59_06220 [Thermoanaerobaculales bacterium]|nr:hypothetical protein [Thermoanaerobaculales bacterium]
MRSDPTVGLDVSDSGQADEFRPFPSWATLVALGFGVIAGTFEIPNTSIGWHLAAGRWMVEHGRILRSNPFTFTAEGVAWLDHEWLFQVIVATTDRLGGGTALVALRMIVVAFLALLLARMVHRQGFGPGPALALAALCIFGARMRFFMRPELATLVLIPLAVDLYLRRSDRSTGRTAFAITGIAIVGINLHGGILVLLPLLGVLWVGEGLRALLVRTSPWPAATSGVTILGAATLAMLVNPWGWRVLLAPVHLSQLVKQPYVPNPEWISPGPFDVPLLFAGMLIAAIVMFSRERDAVRWLLFLAAAALALRYVRNVGLFFVLLPLVIAPALARLIPQLKNEGRRVLFAGLAIVGILTALLFDAPGFPLGFGFSTGRYPVAAGRFLEDHGLLSSRIYNDVRFGGWFIGRYYPPVKAFIDDRNEVHEEVLAELWDIERSSSPGRWQAMLDHWKITTALLRYHEPISVVSPEGRALGLRGFSALWFPKTRWAVVYWDDISMVLVDRLAVEPDWLTTYEYHVIRPDDVDHLAALVLQQPELLPQVQAELVRKITENPDCLQAAAIAYFVLPK